MITMEFVNKISMESNPVYGQIIAWRQIESKTVFE